MSSKDDEITTDQKIQCLLTIMLFTLVVMALLGCLQLSVLRRISNQLDEVKNVSSEGVNRLSGIERREWSALAKAKLVPACEANPDGSYDTARGQHVSNPARELSGIDCPEPH